MNLSIMKIINILAIGSISTIIILLMIEVAFAQFLVDLIIGNVSNNSILFIIILGLFILSMIISIIVGFFIVGDVQQNSTIKASIMSLLCTFFSLFVICNVSLFYSYKEVYENIWGFQIILVFPQVLVYFGIYILPNIFSLFIVIIVIYYIFFVIFLEQFYRIKYTR